MHSIFTARLILRIRSAAKKRQAYINTRSAMPLPQDQTYMELCILPASDMNTNSESMDSAFHAGETNQLTDVLRPGAEDRNRT